MRARRGSVVYGVRLRMHSRERERGRKNSLALPQVQRRANLNASSPSLFSPCPLFSITQRASIAAASPTHPTLASMVSADVAAGVAATRGSAARNLHRVGLALSFLADLLARLAADPALALRAAAGAAYAGSLATCHTGILRAGVRAALYLLPDRASFMASLNESEASAAASAASLVPALRAVVSRVDALYSGVPSMPVSEVKWLPKSSGRKEGAGAG